MKRIEPSLLIKIHSNNLMHQVNNANSIISNRFNKFISKPTKINAHHYHEAIIDLHRTNQSFKMIYKHFENTLEGQKLLVNNKLNKLCSQIDSIIL